jgi:hypothetical protein
MAMNASEVRDTARVLNISPTTVIKALKNRTCARASESCPARGPDPAQIEVERWREDKLAKYSGLSSERDDMWSNVRRKSNPRW